MGKRYAQLQAEERMTLASLHQQGCSLRAIARLQGRSPSTISRELRRNSPPGGYASVPAQARLCECLIPSRAQGFCGAAEPAITRAR